MKILIINIAILIAITNSATYAATHYIRSDADGNGSGTDWINASNNFPDILNRGDTFYIAGGEYQINRKFDTVTEQNKFITIKKATILDHGEEIGWNDKYGDEQAVFYGGLIFESGYWKIDGISGKGKGVEEPYGIKIINAIPRGRGVEIKNNSNFIWVKYVEIQGNGPDGSASYPHDDGVYINTTSNNHLFSHMFLHDFGRAPFIYRNVSSSVIENCYILNNESTSGEHSEGISASGGIPGCVGNVIRYSIWENIYGTGVIVFRGDKWKIYGNLIYNCRSSNGSITTWSAVDGMADVTNTDVINNSIIDSWGYNQGVSFSLNGSVPVNNRIYNNLYYNNENVRVDGGEHDYNLYDDGYHGENNSQYWNAVETPFFDYDNKKFVLRVSTINGYSNIEDIYSIDLNGNMRGEDGLWDIGAYEFNSSNTNEEVIMIPSFVNNLRIILQ